ncbi:MAG: endolytic transglycosylase MltG [Rhodospirillales bacterium]|nr:MAG: endolytic transglycosylase MltG [Rhodospirillales bacterium]
MVVLLGAAGSAAVLGGAYWLNQAYRQPGPLEAEATVVIERGAGGAEIAGQLADAGVIGNPYVFLLGTRFAGLGGALQAGEYRFPPGISAQAAAEMLATGATRVHRITLPEGLTSKQVVGLLQDIETLVGEVDGVPPEGSLLPETYHFARGDRREHIVARMTQAMERTLAELWPARAADLPFDTAEEALILASIVEKEAALPEERPRIAAVFINRLRIGMPLQADPTVAYAVSDGEGSLARPLTRADLRAPSPYNTYAVTGLPPGPIANPGRDSIRAVLNPAVTDELYFVADGTGGHAFARTLAEHNRNVAKWRAHQRRNTGQSASD